MLDEVHTLLDRWKVDYRGRPDLEREQLWLLALEREQIVAVAYREEAVAGRVDALDLDADIRALLRQTLVWTWKELFQDRPASAGDRVTDDKVVFALNRLANSSPVFDRRAS